jgi:hypothetical protein
MTCYKLKLNLRQAGFGLAHEWRKSLELNLRQRPGFALKGIGAGAKRRAIAPLVWSTDGANTPIPFRSKPSNRAPAGAAAQPFWRIFMAERAEASERSPATAPAANLGRSSGSIASNISTRAGFTSEPCNLGAERPARPQTSVRDLFACVEGRLTYKMLIT